MTLKGIIPALVAAYDDDGAVSLERHAALLDHVIGHGVHGVFVGGSTGEAYLQTTEERKRVLAATVEHVAGRVKVIAHTGCVDTRSTIELTRYANELGVDAVSAVTPIYYHYDRSTYRRFFREVSAECDVPFVAYHIPARTHADLDARFFIELAADGVIQGLKYTSTDLYPMFEVIRDAPDDLVVFNGSDEVLLGGLALGAVGGIGSTYNAIGSVYLEVYRAAERGDLDDARRQQGLANHFVQHMARHDFLVFLREILRLQGVETGSNRSPLPVAGDQERQRIRQAVASDARLAAAIGIPAASGS